MTEAAALRRAHELASGLYPHQVEGVAFLLGRRRSILADAMGLGKTRQSAIALTQARPHGPYLVVCPAAVKENWSRELRLALPDVATAIVGPAPLPEPGFAGWAIINYDILGKHLEALRGHEWSGIVFDEAHYLKNHRTKRHRFAISLAQEAGDDAVVHLLTGTPLTSRPRDLFPLLQLVRHSLGRSFLTFAKRYCAAFQGEYGWVADGASNIEELTVQLHGVMLRRTKNEVLDLPPKLRTWLDVEVSSMVARKLSAVVLELMKTVSRRGELLSADGENGSPEAGEDGGEKRRRRGNVLGKLQKARQQLAVAKVRTTIPFVENAIEQGEKVLLFSCFSRPLEKLMKHFGEAAVAVSGEMTLRDRQVSVDRFQNDESVRFMAAQIVAGGVGLNLTAARQVVFNDLDWVPVNHWQAEDRAYRIGQTAAVNVTYMVAAGTVDEFVRTVLEERATLIDQLVEGTALPEDLQMDVMGELRRVMGALEPQLDLLTTGEVDEAKMRELLEVAGRAFRESQEPSQVVAKPPPPAALEALARVLTGPTTERDRVDSSSKPGTYYELEVDGGDVICNCKGFGYRGSCQHARTLKDLLVSGGDMPPGFSKGGGSG